MKIRILICLAFVGSVPYDAQAKINSGTKKKIGAFLGTAATVAGAAGAAYYGYNKYKENQTEQGVPATLDEATFDDLEADQPLKNNQQNSSSSQSKTIIDPQDFDTFVYLFAQNKAYTDITSQKNYIRSKYPNVTDREIARVINAVMEKQKNPFADDQESFNSLVTFLSTDPKFASFDKIKEQKAFILNTYPKISQDVLGQVLGAVQDKLMQQEQLSNSNNSKTDYDILGVSSNASKAEIRKAYLNRSRELHPDKHPKEEAHIWEPQFKELNAAYERLK